MICLFGLWKPADSVCWCRGSHREALWGFYADRSPPVATRPRRQSDGFDFQLFLISASVRRKTVPAMKYSAAPIRVESASSGSTASECFLFFLVAFCFFFSRPWNQTSWDRHFPVCFWAFGVNVLFSFWVNENTNFGSTDGHVELAGVSPH